MAGPSFSLSSHERTRVEDYLNDKIQISADFESLDSLLATLRAQHELQRKQVERLRDRALQLPKRLTLFLYLATADTIAQLAEAQQALLSASKASNDHAEATRKRAEAFKEEQEGIDKRLKAITGSDASDEAAKHFEVSIDKLRRLEISKGYVTLLREGEQLRYLRT
jgi:DNA primase catalytic subunit